MIVLHRETRKTGMRGEQAIGRRWWIKDILGLFASLLSSDDGQIHIHILCGVCGLKGWKIRNIATKNQSFSIFSALFRSVHSFWSHSAPCFLALPRFNSLSIFALPLWLNLFKMSLESFSTEQLLNLKHNIYHSTFIIRNSTKTVGQQRRVIQLQIYNNIINSLAPLSRLRYIFIALHTRCNKDNLSRARDLHFKLPQRHFFLFLSKAKTNNNDDAYCTVGMGEMVKRKMKFRSKDIKTKWNDEHHFRELNNMKGMREGERAKKRKTRKAYTAKHMYTDVAGEKYSGKRYDVE